jgi:hypothetical protein
LKPNLLQYVNRSDKQEKFESNVLNWLEKDNVVILGFPGVGKSATAKAIASKYIEIHYKEKPAVVLSLTQSKKIGHRIELIKVKDNSVLIPVPVISIPFASTKEEDVLKEFINSVGSFEKILKNLNNAIISLSSKVEDYQNVEKIKDILANLMDPKTIPKEINEVMQFAEVIGNGMPYVSAALKISKTIFEFRRNRRAEKLADIDTLIVVDDIADLGHNWEILSHITKYEFHYLFVMRVQPKDYISMLEDPSFSSTYLQSAGLPVTVRRNIVLPPPSYEIFRNIMKYNEISDESKVKNLWKYTGGIPAVALMMSEGAETDEELEALFREVQAELDDDSIVKDWNVEQIETRLAYSFYSVTVIYQGLKKKNLCFAALCCQPDGVAVEELALFCALSTSQLYTFGDIEIAKIYEKVKYNYENEYNGIRLDTNPYVDSEAYDYVLDRNNKAYQRIVEKTVENRSSRNMKMTESIIYENASPFFIKRTHIVYRLNNLFQHIPILLKEAETFYDDLHIELDGVRKRLLLAMLHLITSLETTTSLRILNSAYDHIYRLKDLKNVEGAATSFISMIYSSSRLLYEEDYHDLKIIDKTLVALKGNDVYSSLLLLSMSYRASYISILNKEYASNLADLILMELNKLNLEDRIVLFLYSYSLIIIHHFYDKRHLFEPSELEENVKQICKTGEDDICRFAKASILAEVSTMYVGKEYAQHCEILFTEVEKSICMLEKSDLIGIKKLLPYMSPYSELSLLKAKLNGFMGTFYFQLLDFKRSFEKYSKAVRDFESLDIYDRRISNLNSMLVTKLLDSQEDKDFEPILVQFADMSDDIDNDLLDFSPETLINIYTLTNIANVALQYIYNKQDSLGNLYYKNTKLPDFMDPSSKIRIHLATYCIQKIVYETINFNEFLEKILPNFTSFEFVGRLSLMTDALFKCNQSNKENFTMFNNKNNKSYSFSIDDLKEAILIDLDEYNKNNQHNESLNCKNYRDGTNDGLIKESVCAMINMVSTYSSDIVSPITIHLLLSNYNQCTFILETFSNLTSIPIISYISNKMIKAIDDYRKAPMNKIYRKELAKTYLQFHFCDK